MWIVRNILDIEQAFHFIWGSYDGQGNLNSRDALFIRLSSGSYSSAYMHVGVDPPLRLVAHSTTGVAAAWMPH